MPNTLLGKNISDTYPRLVQVENGIVSDGTGSILPISFNNDGVTITGTLHATTISSSRVTSSVIYTSGSSTFGDEASDTHTFTGAISSSQGIQIGAHGTGHASFTNSEIHITETDSATRDAVVIGGAGTKGYIYINKDNASKILFDGYNDNYFNMNGGLIVGGTSTTRKFEVVGTSYFNGAMQVDDTLTVNASSQFGNTSDDTHTFIGAITGSNNIGVNSTSYIQTPELRGLSGATQLHVQGQITASGNISSSGNIITQHITASGNISASGNVWSDNYYQFETTAKADSDDDTNWQGPNVYGIHTRADWNYDYGTNYDDNSATNAGSRANINTGWRIPHGANYSASIINMQIYVTANSNITHANNDNFSCSMWYSKGSDLITETNVVDGNSGTFIQRHAATALSGQFKAADESLFKYNLYHVSASVGVDLAPGAMLFPRIKTLGTHNFATGVHWVVNYKKIPL